MPLTVYGIPNCDSVKKALAHLKAAGLEFTFHDFKKAGVSDTLLQAWLTQVDLDTLINRKGTTWRQLSESEQAASTHPETALALLREKPSLIKRPVFDDSGTIRVGLTALADITT